MSEISMDKKYKTRTGLSVRVLCNDAKGKFPVIALVLGVSGQSSEYIIRTTLEGSYYEREESENDLIEVSPYDDFEIDEPVMVRDSDGAVMSRWQRRYFAGINESGYPLAWAEGMTSWSADGYKTRWDECRRPTKGD